MRASYLLSAAIASIIAFAPSAFAQSDTAAGKRFAVVGSATYMNPDDPGWTHGVDSKLDSAAAPTLSFSWFINDNMALELWGAVDKFDSRWKDARFGKVATVEQQPVALSFQYHFGHPDNTFRPFIGLGWAYSDNSISKWDGNFYSPAQSGYNLRLKSENNVIGTIGVDMNITPTWFARADVRYMQSKPDMELTPWDTGIRYKEEFKTNPWMVSFGLGARF